MIITHALYLEFMHVMPFFKLVDPRLQSIKQVQWILRDYLDRTINYDALGESFHRKEIFFINNMRSISKYVGIILV